MMRSFQAATLGGLLMLWCMEAQSALAQDLGQAAPLPQEICLTNACSEAAAVKPALTESDKAIMARLQSQNVAAGRMSYAAFGKSKSELPDGFRVELKTALRTRDGHDVPATLTATHGQSNFSGLLQSPAGEYMIGAVVNASGSAIQINAAYQLDGALVVVPQQITAAGQSVSANMPDGSRLTMTAVLRPETDQERAMSNAVRQRLNSRP